MSGEPVSWYAQDGVKRRRMTTGERNVKQLARDETQKRKCKRDQDHTFLCINRDNMWLLVYYRHDVCRLPLIRRRALLSRVPCML